MGRVAVAPSSLQKPSWRCAGASSAALCSHFPHVLHLIWSKNASRRSNPAIPWRSRGMPPARPRSKPASERPRAIVVSVLCQKDTLVASCSSSVVHKYLISKTSHKKSLFLFDLLHDIVYSAALCKEWRSMEALSAFIYADVNTYCPITPMDRKERMPR